MRLTCQGVNIFLVSLLSIWDTGSDWAVVVVWLGGLDDTGPHYWWGGILLTCILAPTIINFYIVLKQIDTLPWWTLLFALCGLAPVSFAIGMLCDGKIMQHEERFYLTKLIELFMEAIISAVLQLYVLFHFSAKAWELGKDATPSDYIVWFSVLGSICSIGGGSVAHKEISLQNILRAVHIALNFVARSLSLILIPIIIPNYYFGLSVIGGIIYLFEFGIVICCIGSNEKFSCFDKFVTASIMAVGNVPTITSFCFRWSNDFFYEVELHVRFLGEIGLLVLEILLGTKEDMPWGLTGLGCSVLGMIIHSLENYLKLRRKKTEVFDDL